MTRLRIRELAEQQGLNPSQLSRRADISMNTARRYWHGTRSGSPEGQPLEELSLPVLVAIARVLGVKVKDLLEDEQRARYVASRE